MVGSLNPVHCRIRRPVPAGLPPRGAVFLDRDGVIVEEVGYLHRTQDIRYIDGALNAIASLNRVGIPVVVVTNQSGVGRGYYGWPEYEQVQSHIEERLTEEGGWLDAALACACPPGAVGEWAEAGLPFRKPNPGMILAAAERLALDVTASWLVGDKPADIEAALRAGLRGAIHVLTGYGSRYRAQVQEWAGGIAGSPFEVHYADSLADAVQVIGQAFACPLPRSIE